MIAVLLGVPELPQEPDLVRTGSAAGVDVLRRCVDAVDLLAAAAAAPDAVAVVSADLPRLSRDAVERIAGRPGAILGLAAGSTGRDWLTDLGVPTVVGVGSSAPATWRTIVAAASARVAPQAPTGVWASGCWIDDDAGPAGADDRARDRGVEPGPGHGLLVAVWGPQGAPGRTTVAIALADEFATAGHPTCLVDADTYAPSVALALGLDDAGADLLAAARCADSRSVAPTALRAVARPVRGGLAAVTGLTTPRRWPELRPASADRLWQAARAAFDVTVVDVGFCLEHEVDPGPFDRQRNAAAVTAVAAADVVVVVADASAAGAARLGGAWQQAEPLIAGRPSVTVRNRARRDGGAWTATVLECGVPGPVVDLPADETVLAQCWAHGRTLGEGGRRSRLRRATSALAAACLAAVGDAAAPPVRVDTGQ